MAPRTGDKAFDDLLDRVRREREVAHQAGIKEVVEWMKSKMELARCDPDTMGYFNDYVWIDYQEWQDKLKEWGL